jgi:hypothetical protein
LLVIHRLIACSSRWDLVYQTLQWNVSIVDIAKQSVAVQCCRVFNLKEGGRPCPQDRVTECRLVLCWDFVNWHPGQAHRNRAIYKWSSGAFIRQQSQGFAAASPGLSAVLPSIGEWDSLPVGPLLRPDGASHRFLSDQSTSSFFPSPPSRSDGGEVGRGGFVVYSTLGSGVFAIATKESGRHFMNRPLAKST